MKKRCFGLRQAPFARAEGGAAALEFALIAPVFIALIFAVFEAGYFFFVTSAVDQAAARAARLIRTGQAQSDTAPITRQDFFDKICDVVKQFGDCGARLTVDVKHFSDFDALAADASAPTCRDADDAAVAAMPYDVGAQRDIVRVRVCYLYHAITPGLGFDLAKAADGSRELVSVTIFRNEPYSAS